MKKGVLAYNFIKTNPWILPINTGDYIQSLAAMGVVDETIDNKVFIQRENFKKNYSKEEKIKLIVNGWFAYRKSSIYDNENIVPLFTSFHLRSSFKLNDRMVRTLQKYEPIGCRDKGTVSRLEAYGIKAYFSGCITLAGFKRYDGERKGIVFALDTFKGGIKSYNDLMKNKFSKPIIEELLKTYTLKEIENATFLKQLSHPFKTTKKQFKIAEEWLEKLKTAEIVVTSRIHSLMPSMSMGTPALIVIKNINDDRFDGLKDFWNIIDYTENIKNENSEVIIDIKRDNNNKIVNKDFHIAHLEPEVKKIREFWTDENNAQ